MVELSERFEAALRHANSTVADVARGTGLTYQALKKVLDGKTKSQASPNNLAIARFLGVSSEWLSSGRGQMVPTAINVDASALPEHASTEFAGHPRASRRVPVVGTAKMGKDGFYDEISSVTGTGGGHIEIATEDPNAYCLRVHGQSMFPAVRDGWYILVKPNDTAVAGEYVLFKFADGRKTLKELLFRRKDSIEVSSVNGSERMTFDLAEIEGMEPVGAVVSPGQWRID